MRKDELDHALSILEQAGAETGHESLITFREAAKQLNVSARTIGRMLSSGELSGKLLRPNRRNTMRILQSSLDELLSPIQPIDKMH